MLPAGWPFGDGWHEVSGGGLVLSVPADFEPYDQGEGYPSWGSDEQDGAFDPAEVTSAVTVMPLDEGDSLSESDSDLVEVDVFEFIGELGAPGGPDVFGLDETQGQRDLAEACAGGSLFREDFVNVGGGEAAHLAEDLAHSASPRVHDAAPSCWATRPRCGGRATTCP